jgi:hypothetical protein
VASLRSKLPWNSVSGPAATVTSPEDLSSSVLRSSVSAALPSGTTSSPSTRMVPFIVATLFLIVRQLASSWTAPTASEYRQPARPLGLGGPWGSSPVSVPGAARSHRSRWSLTPRAVAAGAWTRTFQRPGGGLVTVASAERVPTLIDSPGRAVPTASTDLSGRTRETCSAPLSQETNAWNPGWPRWTVNGKVLVCPGLSVRSTSLCCTSQLRIESTRSNTPGMSPAELSENACPPERRAMPDSSPAPTSPKPTAKMGTPAASIAWSAE